MEIKVNNDKEFVEEFRQKLKENNGYCPCSIFKNENTKCMCKEFLEQQKPGYCTCKLYYKEVKV